MQGVRPRDVLLEKVEVVLADVDVEARARDDATTVDRILTGSESATNS